MESLKTGESTCVQTQQDISSSPLLPQKEGPTNKRLSILEQQKFKDLRKEISIMKNRLQYIETIKQKADQQILHTKKYMKKQKTAQEKKRAVKRLLSCTQTAIEIDMEKKKDKAKAIKSEIQAKKGKGIEEIHKNNKIKVRKVRDESRKSELQIRMQREKELQQKRQKVEKIRNQKKSESKTLRNNKFLNQSTSLRKFKIAKVSCLPLTDNEDIYGMQQKKQKMQKELENLRNQECNKLLQLQTKLNLKQKILAQSKLANF